MIYLDFNKDELRFFYSFFDFDCFVRFLGKDLILRWVLTLKAGSLGVFLVVALCASFWLRSVSPFGWQISCYLGYANY